MPLEVTTVNPDEAVFTALSQVFVDSQLDLIDDWRRLVASGHQLDLRLLKDGQWVLGGAAYAASTTVNSSATLTTICSLFSNGELEMLVDSVPLGAPTEWWVRGSSVDPAAAVAAKRNFALSRRIDKMVLNSLEPADGLVAFQVENAGALAALNNAAFVDHKDRSSWTAQTVLEEMKTLGTQPEDIRLLITEGQIEGFVWTRMAGPHSGEIQVLAVDPRAGGRGHGRALLRAGLGHLHGKGVSRAFLYVDAENVRAKNMYAACGFKDVEEPLVSYLIEPK